MLKDEVGCRVVKDGAGRWHEVVVQSPNVVVPAVLVLSTSAVPDATPKHDANPILGTFWMQAYMCIHDIVAMKVGRITGCLHDLCLHRRKDGHVQGLEEVGAQCGDNPMISSCTDI